MPIVVANCIKQYRLQALLQAWILTMIHTKLMNLNDNECNIAFVTVGFDLQQ